MSASDPTQLQRYLQGARSAALANVSKEIRDTAIFRECLCWPEQESPDFDAQTLRDAIKKSLGPARESVFSFLRYFDYARWQAHREALSMASEQRDWYLPLHVYWELTRHAVLFQRSQQPDYIASDLSILETARYVADAVDSAGQLYQTLGLTGSLAVQIQITGVGGRSVDGSSLLCAGAQLRWRASHTPSEWTFERDALAHTCVRALLSQCNLHLDSDGLISRGLDTEFTHLDARRAVVS